MESPTKGKTAIYIGKTVEKHADISSQKNFQFKL
jgi:hypothetical protein